MFSAPLWIEWIYFLVVLTFGFILGRGVDKK